MTDFPLSLSTAVKAPDKFLVDGSEYEMLGTDHLSPADEAYVLALISRHNILTMELANERVVDRGRLIAERQRRTRIDVITKLTSLPQELANRLPMSQQVLLLEALRELIEVDVEMGDGETEEQPVEDENVPATAVEAE